MLNSRIMPILLAFVIIIFFNMSLCAMAESRIPICIHDFSEESDNSGVKLIYFVKELTRSSNRLKLVTNSDAKYIVSIQAFGFPASSKSYTVFSVIIVRNPSQIYKTSFLGIEKGDNIKSAAETIIAYLDKVIK